MKKSRAVVKSDNTDKMMNFLSGTVSEQLTDTQQDGQIEITTELLYKLVCRNCFGLNLPDVKFFQSSLKSEVLSFREFRLYYVGDSMFSCEFTIGIDPTFTCHITGFYVAVNDGNVISKQFNENFKYSVLLELAEEQSDIGQSEEQSDNGQSDSQQSDNAQSDNGQTEDYVERIKELRKNKGYSQRKVAKLLSKSQQGYAHLENRNAKFTVEDIIKLSEFYNVSTDYILFGKQVEDKQSDDEQLDNGQSENGQFDEYSSECLPF